MKRQPLPHNTAYEKRVNPQGLASCAPGSPGGSCLWMPVLVFIIELGIYYEIGLANTTAMRYNNSNEEYFEARVGQFVRNTEKQDSFAVWLYTRF